MTRETTRPKIAVIGATGFVGSAISAALTAEGVQVIAVTAPRILASPQSAVEAIQLARELTDVSELVRTLTGCVAVVNAAGVSTADGKDAAQILGANGVLPRVVREATVAARVPRMVHVSSASVQGRIEPMDETLRTKPFSLYTRGKAMGEAVLHDCPETVLFRPTSVQGEGRSVTKSLTRLAKSRFASVAGNGERPSPQVLVQNVGSAVAFVCLNEGPVPKVVMQPSEGVTTGSLMEMLGGKRPVHVPLWIAETLVLLASWTGRFSDVLAANSRRLEILWMGQRQVSGWVTKAGWTPPEDAWAWRVLSGASK